MKIANPTHEFTRNFKYSVSCSFRAFLWIDLFFFCLHSLVHPCHAFASRLEPAIQPTGNWITSLIKHKAEKIAAGLFDHFLGPANLIATRLARGNHDSDAI